MRFEILHFNDVYNVEEDTSKDICGGAARFTTALKQAKAKSPENTLILFSGDALSPSIISTTTKGAHMIPILNEMQIDCAVIGNHDFDFGVDNMLKCVENSNFPWLNSNCYEHATRSLLGNLSPFHIVEKQGVRFGFVGLVEADWVETLPMVDEDEVYVKDFCIEARRLASQLKRQFDCNFVIALTHMRWPNDIRLAERVPEIDLILGGHDHNAGFEEVTSANGQTRWVIKSGTDFRQFKIVHLDVDPEGRKVVSVSSEDVFIKKEDFEPDEAVQELVRIPSEELEKRTNKVIGRVEVDLDGRFSAIRTRETNLGNFLCDVASTSVEADCVIINSGSMRIDEVIPAGEITLKILNRLLPIQNPMVVLELTGADLLKVLENSVSQVPKLEGRFAQVGGITFKYSAKKPAGERVLTDSVMVDGKPLNPIRDYKVALNQFMCTGKDGYEVFLGKRVLVDEEEGVPLSTSVINYFRTINVLRGLEKCTTQHKQHLIPISKKHELVRGLSMAFEARKNSQVGASMRTADCDPVAQVAKQMEELLFNDFLAKIRKPQQDSNTLWTKLRNHVEHRDRDKCQVAPMVEGRIVCIDDD